MIELNHYFSCKFIWFGTFFFNGSLKTQEHQELPYSSIKLIKLNYIQACLNGYMKQCASLDREAAAERGC
jgi:hypothetical protein